MILYIGIDRITIDRNNLMKNTEKRTWLIVYIIFLYIKIKLKARLNWLSFYLSTIHQEVNEVTKHFFKRNNEKIRFRAKKEIYI